MKKFLSVTFLMIFSAPASAAWAFFYETPDGSEKTFIQLSSIIKTGRSSSILSMTTYRDPQTIDTINYRSIKKLSEFDCDLKKETLLDIVYYSEPLAHGNGYAPGADSSSSLKVESGSMSASLLRIACR